jgi:uncharacterized membrane protein
MDSSVPLLRKNTRGMHVLMVMGAITIVTLGSILIYWPVISINNPSSIPWGSDTLGHVSRFEFLAKSIQRGIYMPDIYPSWYLGIQLFRYYPSLTYTYFLLIFINSITRQSVLAVNWCIFLCALFGGLSFLLYKKWIGWLPAIAGGLIYLLLPDNVRVAFSEGNIPRVLATAFVPSLFYLILDFSEHPKRSQEQPGLFILGIQLRGTHCQFTRQITQTLAQRLHGFLICLFSFEYLAVVHKLNYYKCLFICRDRNIDFVRYYSLENEA